MASEKEAAGQTAPGKEADQSSNPIVSCGQSIVDSVIGFFPKVTLKMLLTSLVYCVFSSTMSVVNKFALVYFPYGSTLVLLQYVFTFVALGIAALLKLVTIRFNIPFSTIKNILVLSFCFHLSIWSGANVMLHGNVDTFIAFRSCIPLFVILGDSYRTKRQPTGHELLALILIGASGMGFGATDDKFSVLAYQWGAFFLTTTVIESVFVKHILDKNDLSSWEMSFYNNVFSSMYAAVWGLLKGDIKMDHAYELVTDSGEDQFEFIALLAVGLSCVFAIGISVVNFAARAELSPATFSVLGTANKFFTIFVNLLVWQLHSSILATYFLVSAVIGTVVYPLSQKLKVDIEADGKTDWFTALVRKVYTPVIIVLLFVGASLLAHHAASVDDGPKAHPSGFDPEGNMTHVLDMAAMEEHMHRIHDPDHEFSHPFTVTHHGG